MKLIETIEKLFEIKICFLSISIRGFEILLVQSNQDKTCLEAKKERGNLLINLKYKRKNPINKEQEELLFDLLESYSEISSIFYSSHIVKFLNILDDIIKKENIENILKKILLHIVNLPHINSAGIYFINMRMLELRGLIFHSKTNNEKNYMFKKEKIIIKEKNVISDIIFFEQIKKVENLNTTFFSKNSFAIGIYTSNGPVGLLVVSVDDTYTYPIDFILTLFSKLISLAFEFTSTLKKYKFALEDLNFFKESIYQNNNLVNIGKLTATIAHELKNPIVSIGGFTNRLIKSTNDKKALFYLETIKKEVSRLEDLINDLLLYSKNLQLKKEKVNLLKIIEEAITILYDKITSNNIEIKVNVKKDIYICVDKNKILQVLLNILNNSIDALNDYEGVININSKGDNNQIILTIQDNGPGIPEETLTKIFTPFFTTKTHGSGLGLPICKKIMEAHGGNIKISSDKNGTITQLFFIKEECV